MHANWQHSVPAPFSLVAHYDHPLVYLIHVFLPTYLPAVLFRFHLLTYLLYLAVVSLEETFAYSGYNMLPSAFILGGMARRQEKHLMRGGYGNYGCFGLVDFAMGTSIGEDLIDDVIDEAEEKQVAKKTKRKVKGARQQVLKNTARKGKKDDGQGREEEQAEGEEDYDDDDHHHHHHHEEGPRNPNSKAASANMRGNVGANAQEEANTNSSEEKIESARKRPFRTRRSEKKSSEEDAEAGVQDDEIKAEEMSKPKARGGTRKGSQKSKTAGRPRKRIEENGDS